MEALTLLRYWRSNAAGDGAANANVTTTSTGNTTTIVTGVNSQTSETEEDDENDHGPFFDLEFSLPAEDDKIGETENAAVYGEHEDEDDEDEDSGGSEMNFTLMSGSSGDSTADVNVSVSPSDDLFFNGGFVPVDPTTEISSKHSPQLRLALMKSATKFRVMMLKFRKSKLNAESTEEQKKEEVPASLNGENTGSGDSSKSMTVKFKVEEVPIISLFKRHNSSKPSKKGENDNQSAVIGNLTSSEEKKFSKETMQKYLRKVKPLYVRVSQKYGEKLKLAGNLTFTKPNLAPEEQKHSPYVNPRREKESISEAAEPPLLPITAKGPKQGNLPAGLRVVCKHLGKTWSASPAIAAASTTTTAAAPGAIPSKRRDDSLIQQEDGIQSAILHCKRSFKSSRDSDSSSSLSRTGSDTTAAGKCESSWISDAVEEMKK